MGSEVAETDGVTDGVPLTLLVGDTVADVEGVQLAVADVLKLGVLVGVLLREGLALGLGNTSAPSASGPSAKAASPSENCTEKSRLDVFATPSVHARLSPQHCTVSWSYMTHAVFVPVNCKLKEFSMSTCAAGKGNSGAALAALPPVPNAVPFCR